MRDVRLADLHEIPEDREWAAVLLLCGNLGLGGSWDGNRRLLTELARRPRRARSWSATPSSPADILVSARDMVDAVVGATQRVEDRDPALVEAGGVERHLEDGDDHAVLLRKD